MAEHKLPDDKPKGYDQFVSMVRAFWADKSAPTAENLAHWWEDVEKYAAAASDMTKDELSLVSAYVQQEMTDIIEAPGGYQDSAFYHALQDTAWEWLLALSDKASIEQFAVQEDLQHAAGYRVGEWMAPGIKSCILCGHTEEITHATLLSPCIHCDGVRFRRKPLSP